METNVFKETTVKDALKKQEIIHQVAELTGMRIMDVTDVINAFIDLSQKEVLTRGAFHLPGVFNIRRLPQKGQYKYLKIPNKTILMPETMRLSGRVSDRLRILHRSMMKQVIRERDGVTQENWWEPYVVGDGNLLEGNGVVSSRLKK